MSILDTFYILFKTDTKELKKGTDEAEKSTKHLEESLKKVGKQTEHIGGSFLALSQSFGSLLAGVFSASVFANGINSSIEFGQHLNQTSKILNVNAQDLQAWGSAVERVGGNADDFQRSLTSLASHFNSSNEVALRALPRLADAFERLHKINPTYAMNYAKSFGLDESTILLLQKGRREVELIVNREKDRQLLSKENIELFEKYRQATVNNTMAQRDFYNTLSTEVLPVLTVFKNLSSDVFSYLEEHKGLVIGALIGIGIGMIFLAKNTLKAIGALNLLKKASGLKLLAKVAVILGLDSAFEDLYEGRKGNPNAYSKKIYDAVKQTKAKDLIDFNPTIFTQGFQVPNFLNVPSIPRTSGVPLQNAIIKPRTNHSIHIGTITINAESNEPDAIVGSLRNYVQTLETQQAQAINHFDDGVKA